VKNIKLKSYCKVNLSLKILKKIDVNYHKISTLITFCNLYDVITVSRIKGIKDKVNFSGRFNKGIDRRSNTITKLLYLLKKKKIIKNMVYRINIKKNIPHGSGLGGGSSNAAALLKYFNFKMKLKLNKNELEKLAYQIGFDVPICLERKNTFYDGKKNVILRLNNKFKFNILIIYPNLNCSTKKIYGRSKKTGKFKQKLLPFKKNMTKIIDFLINETNDLENAVIGVYPIVGKILKLIKFQNGCLFSRITGSGSACIGIFSNTKNAIFAQKMIKSKYPKYWSVVSKTI